MKPSEYGPIPISRIKEEAGHLFEALQGGRRVSLARHGRVVAIIEPASVEKYAHELAEYALPTGNKGLLELTASEIGQGSPSSFIRQAESGHSSLVTRGNKVYGVLKAVPTAEGSSQMVDLQEEALKQFEHDHPDATAAEFAEAAESVSFEIPEKADGPVAEADELVTVLIDALHTRAVALYSSGQEPQAKATYQDIIARFGNVHNTLISQQVAGSMVELAKIYTQDDNPAEAIAVLDLAISKLQEADAHESN